VVVQSARGHQRSANVSVVVRLRQGSDPEGGSARSAAVHPESFARFYEELEPRVLRYFRHRTKELQDAMDLTAETFARAFEDRARFRGSTDVEAVGWLWAIARVQLNMSYRRGRIETAALDRLRVRRPAATEDEVRRIEQLVDVEASSGVLADAFDGLSKEEQRVIEMHVIDERPYGEIVIEFGLPSETAARARVSRALRKLANNQTLQHSWEGTDDGET
jgi:RNA polymerase sigma-70 factor (ECF subfamily)